MRVFLWTIMAVYLACYCYKSFPTLAVAVVWVALSVASLNCLSVCLFDF